MYSWRSSIVKAAPLAIIWLISTLFYLYQLLTGGLGHYDSQTYISLAKNILLNGGAAFAPGLDYRTLGYPTLLSFSILFFGTLGIPEIFAIFLFQTTIWTIVVMYAKAVVVNLFPKFAVPIAIALSANFFVSPYFSVSLTDATYVSIATMLFFWMWAQFSLQSSANKFTNLKRSVKPWFGVLLFSLALAVRPAALWLIAPLLFGLVGSLKKSQLGFKDALQSVLATLPIFWQAFLNLRTFGVFTPLPVADLGGSQLIWGIQNVKYATWLGSGSPANYYPSLDIIGPQDATGLEWYFKHPLLAARLIFTSS